MPNRAVKLLDFVNESGWGQAKRRLLAADASTRSYDRLHNHLTNDTRVLMNESAKTGSSIPTFLQVTEILRKAGFSAPKIHAADPQHGFLLIEDLGDDLFAKLCESNAEIEKTLYETAIDVLLELHRHPAPKDIALYDASTYLREARLLTEWYLPAATQTTVSSKLCLSFDNLINQMCAKISSGHSVLVLRDFHAENLLWLPARYGVKRVGLLDYQDALIGHPAYDLVSLLEDARRDTSPELRADMLQKYIKDSKSDPEEFTRAYAILGAQRNIKIIGIFSRLFLRDGKEKYLTLIPRVWDHLQRDLTHPALAELGDWIEQHVPAPNMTTLNMLRSKTHVA